jgi:plasmid replication initiation protein
VSNKNDIVIKNKILINISSNSTLSQRRLFNVLLHKLYDQLGDFSKQCFELNNAEIIKILGGENKLNYKTFLDDCIALMETKVTWNLLETDKGLEKFSVSVLLSSVELEKGTIKIELPHLLRKKLIENNQYIKFNLQLQNKFASKYSLILYELCKEFYREKDKIGETPWLEVQNLREMLGLETGEYREFKTFKRDVITKAVKEINKISDLSIELNFKKVSKKIVAIKVKMKPNENYFNNQETNVNKSTIGDIEIRPESISTTTTHIPILSQCTSFGISSSTTTELLTLHTPEYIQSKIDLTYSYIKQKKIKTSPSGFLIRAITEDFGGKITDIDNLLSQEALEARRINLETFSISPTDYSSQEEFEARIIELESQYYNPRWSEMDMNIAKELWKLQQVPA